MARLRPSGLWLILLNALILPRASWSEDAVPAGYRAIAAERGIPESVLYAVALTESGKPIERAGEYRPWPWTLNVASRESKK